MKLTDGEYIVIIAALRTKARSQESATKAINAETVENTRSAIVKMVAARAKAKEKE